MATALVTNSHGTAVCGIIGAEMDHNIGTVGVAPQSKIRPWQHVYDEFSVDWELSEENQIEFGFTTLS